MEYATFKISNKCMILKNCINSKEDTCESKHVNTYRQKIQDVPMTQCFCCERLFFQNNLKLL